jgi:hypothetical protein
MSLAGHFPWQIKLSNIRQDTVTFNKLLKIGHIRVKRVIQKKPSVHPCHELPGVSKHI